MGLYGRTSQQDKYNMANPKIKAIYERQIFWLIKVADERINRPSFAIPVSQKVFSFARFHFFFLETSSPHYWMHLSWITRSNLQDFGKRYGCVPTRTLWQVHSLRTSADFVQTCASVALRNFGNVLQESDKLKEPEIKENQPITLETACPFRLRGKCAVF